MRNAPNAVLLTGCLSALRSMLAEAVALLEAELVGEACEQLYSALLHVDGEPRPGDFAAGPAVAPFAETVRTLRERLECSPG